MYFERADINNIEGERNEYRLLTLWILVFFVCFSFLQVFVGIVAALCKNQKWVTITFCAMSVPCWVAYCGWGFILVADIQTDNLAMH